MTCLQPALAQRLAVDTMALDQVQHKVSRAIHGVDQPLTLLGAEQAQ
jgi:hypothetical protein